MIDLKTLLQEEKNLGKNPYYSYKVASLEDIDSSILAMKKVETKENLRQEAIAMEYDNPDSIVLSFVAGRINLLLNPHEAQIRLNNLMNIFHDKRNYECAAFIATTILNTSESPTPLLVLGEIAESNGDEKKKWEYYERYVRCNSNDTDIITLVADNYEKNGDKKNAKNFYQRSLNRLLVSPDNTKIKNNFSKLLSNNTSDFSFYSTYLAKLNKSELALDLAKMLLSYLYKEKESFTEETTSLIRRKNIENIISVCRTILSIDSADAETREKLSQVLKERYSKSSRYEDCSKHFDVTKANIDPVKALDDFLKNIAYSKNTYVLQNATKKVGLITDVSPVGLLTVKFSTRPGDEVKINIQNAMQSLTALSNQDIRAIKKGKKVEVIKEKIFSDGGYDWLLVTMLISSPGKSAQIKEMKEELVPSVLNEKEWDSVSKSIKQMALINPYIDIINKNTFHLRDYPSTREERLYETFIGYKDFSKKVSCLLEASDDDSIDFASDSILEMVRYFADYLKDEKNSIATRIEALLVVESMGEKGVPIQSDLSFTELYSPLSIIEKKSVYEGLSCKNSKKAYVDMLCDVDKKAYDTLELIFPVNPTKELMRKMNQVNAKKFSEYMARTLSDYKNNLIAFCFFVENGVTKNDLKNCKINQDEFILTELNALSFLYSSYAEDRQRKALRDDLIGLKNLSQYLKSASEEDIKKLSSHLVWNAGLTEEEKEGFKSLILARFPNFDFGEKEVKEEKHEVSVMRGFMCTKASFDRKQAELIDIKENQIPFTLHEIKTARELGDLRENSEYQYAKDHKIFLDREFEKLANELSSVKIMTDNDVVAGRVGFGTKVTLLDKKTNETKTFTFFGRWESDPDNNIIDINAPIGQSLINHIVGDTVEFKNGSLSTTYLIQKIEKVSVDR